MVDSRPEMQKMRLRDQGQILSRSQRITRIRVPALIASGKCLSTFESTSLFMNNSVTARGSSFNTGTVKSERLQTSPLSLRANSMPTSSASSSCTLSVANRIVTAVPRFPRHVVGSVESR